MQAGQLERITSYRILRELGVEDRGAYGNVYLAEQPLVFGQNAVTNVSRRVAVKQMKPQYNNNPTLVRRFTREIELLTNLRHPHIVPLLDGWRDAESGLFYIVMPYLDGESLARRIARFKALDPDQVAKFLDQIGTALAYVHSQRILHRDLKPANILFDIHDNAYLADFGIASDLNTHSPSGSSPGTPAYDAPEILDGLQPTPATDIYSLGITVFEMLTGELPFAMNKQAAQNFHRTQSLPKLSSYNPQIPASLNDVLQMAVHKDPDQRYRTALYFREAFREALGKVPSMPVRNTLVMTAVEVAERENPYVGLKAFREADAANYFGRTALITQMIDAMAGDGLTARFLAVVGPSGSGKSSVVRAGLVPRLRDGALAGSENWYIATFKPGHKPFEELDVALRRLALDPTQVNLALLQQPHGLSRMVKALLPQEGEGQILLVIDQFEELFTQTTSAQQRSQFLDNLTDAILDDRCPLRVVVTLRADHLDHPLQHLKFGELLRERMMTVLPLNDEELTAAITLPAHRVGLTFQQGLVERIAQDVQQQPGQLPLLQFALTALVEASDTHDLTHRSYEAVGGVVGGLSYQAERMYNALDHTGQDAVRQVFLRLVKPGEAGDATRRRVYLEDVMTLATDEIMNALIQQAVTARLLTVDRDPITRQPTVEIAHEALIRTWERLGQWIEFARDEMVIHQRLSFAAHEWESSERDPGLLVTGLRLAQFSAWRDTTQLVLSGLERTFLDESIAQAEELHRIDALRKAREARIAQRASQFFAAALAFGIMVVAAVGGGLYFRAEAKRNAAQAAIASTQSSVAATDQAVAEAGSTQLAENSALFERQQNRVATLSAGGVVVPLETLVPDPEAFDVTQTAVAQLIAWDVVERVDDFGAVLVQVPAGCFFMGSVTGGADTQPTHRQCFETPFWIDKFEVTNGQFTQVTGVQAPSSWPGDARPVDGITWFGAMTFCERRGARLPTEAEWEYAARGPDSLVYPWGNVFDPVAVIHEGSVGTAAVVSAAGAAIRPEGASWVGAMDMSGNVWEWTSTRFDDVDITDGTLTYLRLYSYPYVQDDRERKETRAEYQQRINEESIYGLRVMRGGGYNSTSTQLGAAVRIGVNALDGFNEGIDDRGFRCVRADE